MQCSVISGFFLAVGRTNQHAINQIPPIQVTLRTVQFDTSHVRITLHALPDMQAVDVVLDISYDFSDIGM